jgi:hypothetical protein
MREAQKGFTTMKTAVAETTENTATVAEQGANVAPEKATSKKGATQKKDAPKGQKTAKGAKTKDAPKNAKAGKKAGFLSTAAKKHGLKIESTKTEAGDRLYQIKK